MKIVSPALGKKRIDLDTDMEPAVILGSQELLVGVFINLIDNARKASAENGTIEFTGRLNPPPGRDIKGEMGENPAEYEFSVIDHGVGMSEEDVGKICDEFYMVDKSRSRREGGAGLGMSLAALILERHGVRIVIESTLGEGTKMWLTFPAAGME